MTVRDYFKNFSWRVDTGLITWIIITAALLAASIVIILKGPVLGSDSYSYLDMEVSRPPGYPLFLYLMRMFGEHYLMITVIVQTLFNAAVFIIFFQYIRKRFNIPVLYMLFLLPLAVYYFIAHVEPQKILTESVAFPLFLLLSICFIEGLIKKNLHSFIIVLVVNTVLVLIRGQFLYVYPLVILAGIYVFIRNKKYIQTKYITVFSLAVILSFASYALINRVYHYILHDTFTDTQTNMSFIRNAMYISGQDDYTLFENELLQNIHRDLYDSLYSAGFNKDGFDDKVNPIINREERRRSDLIEHYHENLINIAHVLRSDIIREKFPEVEETEFAVTQDKILRKLSFTLIPENFSLYLYLIASEIIYFGFNASRVYLLMFILLFAISTFGLIKENIYGEITFFFLIAYLSNLLLMALSNRVLGRYSIYIQFVILSLLLVFFLKIMLTEKPDAGQNAQSNLNG